MSYSTRDFLVHGIAAAKAKEADEARRYLERALNTEPDFDQKIEILWWLSEISTDPVEQRRLVEDILANQPTESRARRKIAILDGRLKPDKIVDPDRIPAPAAGELAVDANRFICPKCGGRMSFAPDGQSLTCEYCESRESLKRAGSADVAEQEFVSAMATAQGHQSPAAFQTFTCRGCSASFVLSASQITLTCPYCDSSYVVRQEEAAEFITPGGVVPFRINENQARQALAAWMRENLSDLDVHVARGSAIYLPAWTFDLTGNLAWRGYKPAKRGKPIEPISGTYPVLENDLLIPATRRLSQTCQAELAHFDLSTLVPFDERFLASWPAETYQLSAADASLEARRLALAKLQGELQISLDRPVNDLTVSSSGLSVSTFRLVLLPVWLNHYTSGEKRYEVVINGYNGAVRAEKPAGSFARWLGLS